MKTNLAHEPPIPQGQVVHFPKNERKAMSEKKFNYVTGIRDIPMEKTTKHVAITLATYADYETGICYPTIKTLMIATGLSNRAVCLHLSKLEELGFIVSRKADGRNSKYKFIAKNIQKAVTQSHHLHELDSDFDNIEAVTLTQEAVTLTQEAVTLTTQSSDAESHKHPITIINYQEQPESISEHVKTEQKTEGETQTKSTAKKRESGKAKTSIPENFTISEQVKSWAKEKNYSHLEQHLEYFIGKCEANGYKYLNWDSAFKTAIRDDWAKLNTNHQPKYQSKAPAQQVPLIGSNKLRTERTVNTFDALEVKNV